MGILDLDVIKEFIRLCEDGWKLGYHEYHGGNVTYRMKPEEVKEVQNFVTKPVVEWTEMEEKHTSLAGEYFLVKGAGECFRNTVIRPQDVFGIVQINETGTGYRVLWGLEKNGRRPTSEFMPHLSIHSIKKTADAEKYRVVYHCHPENVIILSAVMPHDSKTITRALWDMEPECPMTFPTGVGILDWAVPGTVDLGRATGELMKKHDVVIWSQHGILVAGSDFDTTLGVVHTIENSAGMLLRIRQIVGDHYDRPTEEQYRELDQIFHLHLPEEYVKG